MIQAVISLVDSVPLTQSDQFVHKFQEVSEFGLAYLQSARLAEASSIAQELAPAPTTTQHAAHQDDPSQDTEPDSNSEGAAAPQSPPESVPSLVLVLHGALTTTDTYYCEPKSKEIVRPKSIDLTDFNSIESLRDRVFGFLKSSGFAIAKYWKDVKDVDDMGVITVYRKKSYHDLTAACAAKSDGIEHMWYKVDADDFGKWYQSVAKLVDEGDELTDEAVKVVISRPKKAR